MIFFVLTGLLAELKEKICMFESATIFLTDSNIQKNYYI